MKRILRFGTLLALVVGILGTAAGMAGAGIRETPAAIREPTPLPVEPTPPPVTNHSGQLAFISGRDGDNQLYIADIVSGSVERVPLSVKPQGLRFPNWSPDGQELVFMMDLDGVNYDLYAINVETGDLRQLTRALSDEQYPSWSPDS